MRQALKEFNWDWQLWAAMDSAAKLENGTRKEQEVLLSFLDKDMRDHMGGVLFAETPATRLLGKANAWTYHNLITARERGKKIALVTYNFSPAVLFAMDIVPLCLEGFSAFISMSFRKGMAEALDYCTEVGFPETGCSGQRLGLGALLAGMTEKPDMVLYSTGGVCDSNAAAYAFAAEYLDIPACQINYPGDLVGEEIDRYQIADFKRMLRFLEDVTGTKADIDRFKKILDEINTQDGLLNDAQDLASLVPCPLEPMDQVAISAANLFFKGLPVGTDIMRGIVEQGKKKAALGLPGNKEERARGLWCYIDHYCDKTKYWRAVSEMGISHVGSMLTDFFQPGAPISRGGKESQNYEVMDGTDMDSIIRTLTLQTSRLPMIKQIRGPYDAPHMWLEDTISAVNVFKADFMVFMGTMGCRNTWGMVKPYAREMEAMGVPTFISYSDSFDDRVETAETMVDKLKEFLTVRGILKEKESALV